MTVEVYTINAMLRMAMVLQEADFEALIANVALNPPRVVVNHSGLQVDIRTIETPRDDVALQQLEGSVCPRIIRRWTQMCEAVGLPTRVLAQRWFSRQRYFY